MLACAHFFFFRNKKEKSNTNNNNKPELKDPIPPEMNR